VRSIAGRFFDTFQALLFNLPDLIIDEPLPRSAFHHQPEAQHLKSSAIHKLGRPITPSFD
jgi:hypothetical protein